MFYKFHHHLLLSLYLLSKISTVYLQINAVKYDEDQEVIRNYVKLQIV
jgi:hypothetical protein